MDSRKKKILWLAIIILVIIGILVLVWSLLKGEQPVGPEGDLTTDNQPKFEVESLPFKEPAVIKPEQSTEFTIENLARNFTDRYGSWSTDNQGQNLQELFNISTNSMRDYLQSIDLQYNTGFYGATTKTLSADITDLDEAAGEAIVLVQAQRIETKSDLSQNTYYQKAELELVKSGDRWLVNSIYWQ